MILLYSLLNSKFKIINLFIIFLLITFNIFANNIESNDLKLYSNDLKIYAHDLDANKLDIHNVTHRLPISQSDSNIPITTFPLDDYPQNFDYLRLQQFQFDSNALISYKNQLKNFAILKQHYFSSSKSAQSPWSPYFVRKVLSSYANNDIYHIQHKLTMTFTNNYYESANYVDKNLYKRQQNRIGYGLNYLPYTQKWHDNYVLNMQLSQFNRIKYYANNHAIAINNITAHVIPTNDSWFFDINIPGEGYPFDHNLISAIPIGTPLYIIAHTQDQAWSLVLTPHFIAWVSSHDIANVNNKFMHYWQNAVHLGLAIIISPNITLIDSHHQFIAGVISNTILPLAPHISTHDYKVLVPIKDNNVASYKIVIISKNDAVLLPLKANLDNFVKIIDKLLGRTYGWGGYMGFNDCSAELQAVLTPFGYFMPRNSNQQINMGTFIDLDSYSPAQKMQYIINNAIPFMTLIYIKHHIMLYVGNKIIDGVNTPMVYENVWGMRDVNNRKRYIIGKSIIFPLQPEYLMYNESQDKINIKSHLMFGGFKLLNINYAIHDINMLSLLLSNK